MDFGQRWNRQVQLQHLVAAIDVKHARCSGKRTDCPVISTWPAAIVAWPHSSTSSVGVNQRRSKSASGFSLGTVKAVSLRLFSAAIACSSASSS